MDTMIKSRVWVRTALAGRLPELAALSILSGADVSPDSKSLVSCGFDKMLKFWEPEPQWF